MSERVDNPSEQSDGRSRTETDEPDLSIRVPRGRVSGLRRRHVRLAIALLAVVVAAALIVGLGIDFHPQLPGRQQKVDPPSENTRPAPIVDLPSTYADIPRAKSKPPAVGAEGHGGAMAEHMHHDSAPPSDAQHQQDVLGQQLAGLMASIQQVSDENKRLSEQLAAYHSAATQEQAKVWGSTLFFKIDDASARKSAEHSSDKSELTASGDSSMKDMLARASAGVPPSNPPTQPSQQRPLSDQEHKLAFLSESPAPRLGLGEQHPKAPPATRDDVYQLQTGTVIPAALLTGINTDLPGDVLAAVTAPVYDSATGNHLLIPQGAKLYGSYDSQIAASQDRALVVWHRLLMPDGRSVDLDRMRGTDAGGYAGVADQVDYHTDKLASAAVLSGVIAYAGNLARGRQNLTVTGGDVVGDAVAQQASTIGSNIVQRQLNVQPTITVRPGWPVHVLVNRDIQLPLYID
ncbi:MAG TPA: TrbI/VirB10 family protein [Bryobacteraceae bacterium]|nr:TrbI/VirB10 family protein [Bryobacteraceae bacterium]